MGLFEIVLIAMGLAADAFAVAFCKGMAKGKWSFGYAAVIGLYFGGFQALMPVTGYFAGSAFAGYFTRYSHWISFALLLIIGINMLRESFQNGDCECSAAKLDVKTMLPLALATSIDAAAVGVTFAFIHVNIVFAAAVIGIITFAASASAVWLGTKCPAKLKNISSAAGGVVLILIGLKILIQGLLKN